MEEIKLLGEIYESNVTTHVKFLVNVPVYYIEHVTRTHSYQQELLSVSILVFRYS